MRIKKTKNEIKQDIAVSKLYKKVKLEKKNKTPRKVKWYDKEIQKLKKQSYYYFLKSKYWSWVRGMVMERDNKRCCLCGNSGRLQVHHMTYKHHFKEHKHLEDMMTVCGDCHNSIHSSHYGIYLNFYVV